MTAHRWSVGIIVPLDDDQASRLGAMDMPDRLELVAQLDVDPVIIRGPLCLECGVQKRYLDRQPDKPWPCPGKRPESLGSAPAMPDPKGNRQTVRAQRRKAARASRPAAPEDVKARVELAMQAARGKRVERENVERAVGEGYEAIAAALANSDADPSEFWDATTPDRPGLHFSTRR